MANLSGAMRRIEHLQSRLNRPGENNSIEAALARMSEAELDQVIKNLEVVLISDRLEACNFERGEEEIRAELWAEVEAELAASAGPAG